MTPKIANADVMGINLRSLGLKNTGRGHPE